MWSYLLHIYENSSRNTQKYLILKKKATDGDKHFSPMQTCQP